MEAYGEPKFASGKGFPQTYLDGAYFAGDPLIALCKAFASSNFTGVPPAACKTFEIAVDFEIQWPLKTFDTHVFSTMFSAPMDSLVAQAVGGSEGSISAYVTNTSVGLPKAVGNRVALRAHASTLAGFKTQLLSTTQSSTYASLLAFQLNRTGSFPGITGAAINASASPALILARH